MPIFELTDHGLAPVETVRFQDVGIKERQDIQRLLRDQITVVAPDTLIIAEEFGEWEGGRRRIDLLGIDKEANLVVIELKRTEDGGHMDLQAIRYAAMVSAMTFDKAVEVFDSYLQSRGEKSNPEQRLLDFLGWESPDEDEFGQDVRIVLASAEFSKELTTSVLWLNERGLDIRCMRLRPYRHNNRILVDVSQVIPLREAEEYQIQIREKKQRERESRRQTRDYTKYTITIDGKTYERLPKRWAIFHVVKNLCDGGVSPAEISEAIPWRGSRGRLLFRSVKGEVDSDAFIAAMLAEHDAGGQAFDKRRFFCADDQLIVFGDCTYALSNQWGHRTKEAIECLRDRFPDRGIAIRAADDSGSL